MIWFYLGVWLVSGCHLYAAAQGNGHPSLDWRILGRVYLVILMTVLIVDAALWYAQ